MKSARFLLISAALAAVASAQPALTIYNQNFAVVREHVPLDLKPGENAVNYSGVTVRLEPDSVVLRDSAGKVPLQILEQSYRADTISQGLLLSLYEGKTIDFVVRDQNGKESLVKGKVIRSGYVPNAPTNFSQTGTGQPIIEVDGRLRFALPGEPVFPALTDDAILKPLLSWKINTPQAAKLDAELSYVTGGMNWTAAYNLVSPEKGDLIDLIGWVTIDNQSGKTFDNAMIKLMAGDVNKVQPIVALAAGGGRGGGGGGGAPAVTEKAFDEFHLYSLPLATTLRNRETKQVEFIRATGIKSQTLYVYNGAAVTQYRNLAPDAIRNDRAYGTLSNSKVSVMREFANTTANKLGLPLPAGRVRFYRRDDTDGHLEFTGENNIDHKPKDEVLRIYVGDAFDIVGERRSTDYQLNNRNNSLEEAFEIHVRNHKTTPVEVRVAERLYRWINWEIIQKSNDFVKVDAQNVEFRVNVPADGETVVTYRVRYNWQ